MSLPRRPKGEYRSAQHEGTPVSADGIFISYRRSDAQFAAGRLADALVREFGHERIFRDIDDIDAGADFVDTLEQALAECKVMLVIIGSQWLTLCDAQGRPRIHDDGDWVRQEIARALKRGIRVVPVLLERTDIPPDAALPEDLKALTRRQALRLADEQWARDVAALVAALRPHVSTPASPAPAAATQAAPTRLPQAAAFENVAGRVGSGVRTGLTWVMRVLLGLLALLLFLTFLLVRACNDETPDMAGRWVSAEGWVLEFEPQQHEGTKRYQVRGSAGNAGRLECLGSPSMFGALELQCKLVPGSGAADTFACENLYISGTPLTATGECKWPRDGSTRKLALRR